jgi:hypothetical protein
MTGPPPQGSAMNDANAPSSQFRLDELEDRLKALLSDNLRSDKKGTPIGYICCENVGRPFNSAQTQA